MTTKQFKIIIIGITLSLIISITGFCWLVIQDNKIDKLNQQKFGVALTDINDTDLQSAFPALFNANNALVESEFSLKLGTSSIDTLAELNAILTDANLSEDTDTNTNANTICSGGTTYLDGEGNCDDVSSVYQPLDSDLTDLADGTLTKTKVQDYSNWDTAYGWGDHGDLYVPGSGYFGTTTLPALTATTTSQNGIDISSGCFAVDGTCVTGGGGNGYWTQIGSDIYYNNNVFIATSSSSIINQELVVAGDIELAEISSPTITFLDYDTGNTGTLGMNNLYYTLGTVTDTPIYFRQANDIAMVIDNDMHIGIGTTTPQTTLSVNGDISASSTNGIDINADWDTNIDIVTLGVTGSPRLYWHESFGRFTFSEDLWASDIFTQVLYSEVDEDSDTLIWFNAEDSMRFYADNVNLLEVSNDKITFPYASSTGITATNFWGNFIGNLTGTASGNLTSADINTYSELNTLVADQTIAYSGGVFHDGFSDFVANEHIDWTADQGATNIHSGNYEAGASIEEVYGTLSATTSLPSLTLTGQTFTSCYAFASTTAIISGLERGVGSKGTDITVISHNAKVQDGTTLVINLSDGTNDMNSITASGTRNNIAVDTNNTWNAYEDIEIQFGTNTGDVTNGDYCINYQFTIN